MQFIQTEFNRENNDLLQNREAPKLLEKFSSIEEPKNEPVSTENFSRGVIVQLLRGPSTQIEDVVPSRNQTKSDSILCNFIDQGLANKTIELCDAPLVPQLDSDPQGGWKTYNFEVQGHHTYIADGIRVHNNSGPLGKLGNDIDGGLDALFVFVAHPEVEPTNNRSERNVRPEAMARKAARTSKSQSGATRRGVIMTVLATLNTRFEAFTLNRLIDEISQWTQDGLSRFQQELAALEKGLPPPIAPQMA